MSGSSELPARRVEVLRRSARLERLRVRTPRFLLVASLALLCVLGLRSLVSGQPTGTASLGGVPVDNASQQFALRFARAYLSYDSARSEERERALRSLVPTDFDVSPSAIRGIQRVLWAEVASNQEAIAGGRIVVVAAGVSTQPSPIYLAVPVSRVDGAIKLGGYPSMVGPPPVARTALPQHAEVDDHAVTLVATRAIENFLAGAKRNLAADLALGAVVSPPSETLRTRSIDDIQWAGEEGSSAVLVSLTAVDLRGAAWPLTYEVGIAREGGRVVVTFIETVPTDP